MLFVILFIQLDSCLLSKQVKTTLYTSPYYVDNSIILAVGRAFLLYGAPQWQCRAVDK